MGKISEIYYEEIDPKICTTIEAAEFYYLFNMLDIDEDIHKEYEDHEIKQLEIRNKLIGDAIRKNKLPRNPKLNTSILGISSLRDQVILLAEY